MKLRSKKTVLVLVIISAILAIISAITKYRQKSGTDLTSGTKVTEHFQKELDSQRDRAPVTVSHRLITGNRKTAHFSISTHLAAIYDILSHPRPMAQISRLQIIAESGTGDCKTELEIMTNGRGALIDADMLLNRMQPDSSAFTRHLHNTVLTSSGNIIETTPPDHFVFPMELKLRGWLQLPEENKWTVDISENNFITIELIDSDYSVITGNILQSVVNQLELNAVISSRLDSPVKITAAIDLSAVQLIDLLRITYLLEKRIGTIVTGIVAATDKNDPLQLNAQISTEWFWEKRKHSREIDALLQQAEIDTTLAEVCAAVEQLIPSSAWAPSQPINNSGVARTAKQQTSGSFDPGIPDWERAEDAVQIRTATVDSRGRPQLVTTAGRAAENEIISHKLGSWTYRWRVHSITVNRGQLERLEAIPATPDSLQFLKNSTQNNMP